MPITDLKEALYELDECRARYQDLVDSASDWLWEMDAELRFTHITDGARKFNGGVDPSANYGKTREEVGVHDPDNPDKWKLHRADLEARRPFRNFRYTNVDQDGGLHHWSVSGKAVYDSNSAFLGYRGLGRDITERARIEIRLHELNGELQAEIVERRQAEAALRASELRYRHIFNDSVVGTSLVERRGTETDGRFSHVNGAFCEMLGYAEDELLTMTTSDVIHPDDREPNVRLRLQMLEGLIDRFQLENRYIHKTGRTVWAQLSVTVIRDAAGRYIYDIGHHQDITGLKQAEADLRQAQKMEALGQLTGGVAHDFNNILAVIQGNAELLSDQVGDEDKMIQAVMRSTRRGAELTQRLLAFSRQQPLHPRSIDLAVLAAEMSDLLERTLGETILVETETEPGLMRALADPGQLENVLLNLALNARDAMPEGGKLTIHCTNAQLDSAYVSQNPDAMTGHYVMLAVSDTGKGMTADVLEHAFEPFFTTKKVGEGTGLGLSMVYGFAKQSGGHLNIYSEVEHGTTVKLYLPPADQSSRDRETTRPSEVEPQGRGEVVLIIEDDPDVRELAVLIVSRLGYNVIEAPEAQSALAILEQGEPIDLVLSDVVLPGGMSGPEFADVALPRYPGLRIIFMSGYPAEAARRNGFVGSDTVILNKPFEKSQLAIALRNAFEA